MRSIHRTVAAAASLALLAALAGCASQGGGSGGSADKPAAKAAADRPAAAKPADVPPPPGSKLAKVTLGMTDAAVRKAIGEPDSSKDYMSGKLFIPWDKEGSRSEWIYKGQGRVVFSRNRYSGGLTVIRVLYNPAEAGA